MEDSRVKMKASRAQELPKRIRTFDVCLTRTEAAKREGSLFLSKRPSPNKDDNPDRNRDTGFDSAAWIYR